MKSLLFLFALSLVQMQSSAQAPKAHLDGIVVKVGTGVPVTRARIELRGIEGSPRVSRGAMSDGSGRFVFDNVPAGRYRLAAERDGYVRAEYGQHAFGLPGASIEVAAKQELKDLLLQMVPAGAIAGRVLDQCGEPVVNANVNAQTFSYQDGRRVLRQVQNVRTNDRGEYRLFWLRPDKYIVSATGTNYAIPIPPGQSVQIGPPGPGENRIPMTAAVGMGLVNADGSSRIPIPVYFPGTSSVTDATPIDLQPGADFGGVDLSLPDVYGVTIRGQVVSGSEGFSGRSSVMLLPRGSMAARPNSIGTGAGGAFSFLGVAPGSYDVLALSNEIVVHGPPAVVDVNAVTGKARVVTPAPDMDVKRLVGRIEVEVGSANIDNLQIVLGSGHDIRGRLTVDGASGNTIDLSRLQLQLRLDPEVPLFATDTVNVAADGTFTIRGAAPGVNRLQVSGGPAGSYVKSATLAGADVMNDGIQIDGDVPRSLDIVMGTNPATVDLTVLDDKQQPAAGVTCVLVPDPARRHRSELYKSATSDSSGHVQFKAAPGEYKVFAWAVVENGAWQDPDFISTYETRGQAVRLPEGSESNVNVTFVP